MLTRLIVSCYAGLVEILLWLLVLGSTVTGWFFGYRLRPWFDDFDLGVFFQILGAVLGALGAFAFAVIVYGAALILLDVRKSLKRIEQLLMGYASPRS